MDDWHEVTFEWPHPEANTVIVTGTFDQWSSSTQLTKEGAVFKGSKRIPWEEKIAYKFVVDGTWTVDPKQPQETDPSGNVNNVYTAPSKPTPTPVVDEKTEPAANESKADDVPPSDNTAGDIINIVAATEGTTSAVGYVASGLGAAIQAVVGVDPINPVQLPVEPSPTAAKETEEEEVQPTPEPAPEPTPVASIVPIAIVPVNVLENNQPAPKQETPAADSPSTHTPAPPVDANTVNSETVVPADPSAKASSVVAAVEAPSSPAPAATEIPVAASAVEKVAQASHSEAAPETKSESAVAPTDVKPTTSSRPSTPTKSAIFPKSGTPSPQSSPSGTMASRKKRTSIFGKISVKRIFSGKDKEKK